MDYSILSNVLLFWIRIACLARLAGESRICLLAAESQEDWEQLKFKFLVESLEASLARFAWRLRKKVPWEGGIKIIQGVKLPLATRTRLK